ncbi:MAG: benzoyl-CoA-dihydrodiol lyase [Alphaproteobacteria bacterium]|nr:benzoyl-CoA-dihydrodiol lyase [Alphaproteobacteria bacterium]
MIDFRTHPERYKHWKLKIEGRVATLALDVNEQGGLFPGYELKLNSYDLGVDIELADATQRLRFEHPEVGAVILTSAKERVFCAGANIRMLGQSTHVHKVNFCKFTNETRIGIEDASEHAGQTYICSIQGTAAGGGYELALAADYIVMADDGNTAVSLPEVPLLAVLPGTGGLTRLVDKRKVRRDRADFFCTTEEGVRGKRAVDWALVDEVVPRTRLAERTAELAAAAVAKRADRAGAKGITLKPVERKIDKNQVSYGHVTVKVDRDLGTAEILVRGPMAKPPGSAAAMQAEGCEFWPLALARDLDDAIIHLRFNEPTIGSWVFKSEGDPAAVAAYDAFLLAHQDHWFAREIVHFWKRVMKRLDVSARSLFALVEPGSCFAGSLLEIVLAADRAYMLDGAFEGDNRPPARLLLNGMNFGPCPMGSGLTRLEARLLRNPADITKAKARQGEALDAQAADELGLVTFTPDDIDWEDEVRIALEERRGFSPDALTGMEASLRFVGPETMETKIFARLSAWQNWIFQRPNATGEAGALKRYGTGQKGEYDRNRA